MAFSSRSSPAVFHAYRHLPALLALAAAMTIFVVLAQVAHAQEETAVGRIGRIVGEVTVVRGAGSVPAQLGMIVLQDDAVATGSDGRVEILYTDGSTVVLGSGTTVSIARYAPPTAGAGTALLDLIDGILRVTLSAGRTWKSFEVRSATAVASVRSTDWIVDADGPSTAIFVIDGSVAVDSRAGLGGIVLAAGQGTDVRAGEAPDPPKVWGQQRVDGVLARTALP